MTIYFIKDGVIDSVEFDNVANLEALVRELDESYDIWAYSKEELEYMSSDEDFIYDDYQDDGS